VGKLYLLFKKDTAGQEKFNALTPIYYRDAKGAILVYDVTIEDTFKRVKKWVEELKAFNKNTVISIAGNKIDLKNFDIDKDEAIKYSQEENAKHYFTSAKTGEGLEDIFNQITKEIVKVAPNLNRRETKKLAVGKTVENNSKGCCK
jgi:Ras-related protein Rab-21